MNAATSERAPPKPANKRGAARLAAVQALYQLDVAGADMGDVLAEFESYRLGGEIDGIQYREADVLFFRGIVTGVVREQRQLDPLIDATLANGWPLVRIDLTLRAILRAGAFELAHRSDIPVPVVITEYLDLASAFFEGDVPPMVNAIMDAMGRKLRPAVPNENG